MGGSPELSPRWISIYGQESMRIALLLIKERPLQYLKGVLFNFKSKFYGEGPQFLAGISGPFRTTNYQFQSKLFWLNEILFSKICQMTFLFTPLFGIFLLLAFMRNKSTSKADRDKALLKIFIYLVIPLVMFSIIYSAAVGGENDRYFMHIIPLLMILLGIMMQFLIEKNRELVIYVSKLNLKEKRDR